MSKITIPIDEVVKTTSLSESTIKRMILKGTFPKSVKVGTRSLWRVKDIEVWADNLINDNAVKPAKKRGRQRLSV